MNLFEFNNELRNFCTQLVNDGFLKSHICNMLLGGQKGPMFTSFMENEDRNFGLKVLTNIFEGFGYDLYVVPIKKGEENNKELFDSLYGKFTKDYRTTLVNGLNNDQESGKATIGRKGTVAAAIDQIATQLFNDLKKN